MYTLIHTVHVLTCAGSCLHGNAIVVVILSQIAKVDIQQFKSGRTLPACTIELEWTGGDEPKRLSHKVKIIGAQEPDNYFYMRYSPQECECVCVHECVCVCVCVFVCMCVWSHACVHCYFLFFCYQTHFV